MNDLEFLFCLFVPFLLLSNTFYKMFLAKSLFFPVC